MRATILSTLLCLPLLGCSPAPVEELQSSKPTKRHAAEVKLPFTVSWIKTEEEKEKQEIRKQARSLLDAKDYAGLDALAQKYRDSKESYANGFWKLYEVHVGLELSKKASDEAWEAHLADLRKWTEARPKSIAARVKLAEELASYAWRARGGGYAKTVSDEGWKLFRSRLLQAMDVLSKARPLDEKCPRWWTTMMQIANGLGMPRVEYDRLFDEAVRAYPKYAAFYSRKTYYLLPRWHGQPGEWEKFLAKAADEISGEDGDQLYAQVTWIMQDNSITEIFQESRVSWDRVDRGFKILETRFPNSAAARNQHAYLACLAGDRTLARNYLTALKGQVDLSVWGSQEGFKERANWVFAQQGSSTLATGE